MDQRPPHPTGPNPYGHAPNPYGQPPNPHGQAANPYGQAPNPYGQPPSPYRPGPHPYGPGPQPYGPDPNPYGGPNPYGPGLNPYGLGPNPYGPGPGTSPSYGQSPPIQPPYGENQQQYAPSQPLYAQPPQGAPWQVSNDPPAGRSRTPQLVGAIALLVVAIVTTVACVSWISNKAEAISPVDLPSADGTPLKTVTPSVKPSATPPPIGRIVGSNMVASNNDTMPVLSSAWTDNTENSGLYGGAATWLTVHKNYDGKTASWGNYVAFGALDKTIAYKNTPAGRKEAAVRAASVALYKLYGKDVKILGKPTHRPITVQGRPGHELTVRIEVKVPKLKETFSTVAVAVIDRGDGTADASVGDFAGSTPQWLAVWRAKVQAITVQG
jgi:hypothetical protein